MLDKIKAKLTLRNILLCASAIVCIVAFIMFIIVSSTGYYVGKSPNTAVLLLSLAFIIGTVLFIVFDDKIGKWDTLYFFVLAACIILTFVLFVLDKEEVIGEMLVPVNHPALQIAAANLTIVTIVFYGVSFIIFTVASFLSNKPLVKKA